MVRRCNSQWDGTDSGQNCSREEFRFGTKLTINGQVYTVEDRGTAYGHVDILYGKSSAGIELWNAVRRRLYCRIKLRIKESPLGSGGSFVLKNGKKKNSKVLDFLKCQCYNNKSWLTKRGSVW